MPSLEKLNNGDLFDDKKKKSNKAKRKVRGGEEGGRYSEFNLPTGFVGVDPGLEYYDESNNTVVVKPTIMKKQQQRKRKARIIDSEDEDEDEDEDDDVGDDEEDGLEFVKAVAQSSTAGTMGYRPKSYFKNQLEIGKWNASRLGEFTEKICSTKYKFYQLLRTLFRILLNVRNVNETMAVPMFNLFHDQNAKAGGFSNYINYIKEQSILANLRSLKRIQAQQQPPLIGFLGWISFSNFKPKKIVL